MLPSTKNTPQIVVPLTVGNTDVAIPIPKISGSGSRFVILSAKAAAIGGGAGAATIGIFTMPGGSGLTLVSNVALSSLLASDDAQPLTLNTSATDKILDQDTLWVRVGTAGSNSCAVQLTVTVLGSTQVSLSPSLLRIAIDRFIPVADIRAVPLTAVPLQRSIDRFIPVADIRAVPLTAVPLQRSIDRFIPVADIRAVPLTAVPLQRSIDRFIPVADIRAVPVTAAPVARAIDRFIPLGTII